MSGRARPGRPGSPADVGELTGFSPQIHQIFFLGLKKILSNTGKFRSFWPYDINLPSLASHSRQGYKIDGCVRDRHQLEDLLISSGIAFGSDCQMICTGLNLDSTLNYAAAVQPDQRVVKVYLL